MLYKLGGTTLFLNHVAESFSFVNITTVQWSPYFHNILLLIFLSECHKDVEPLDKLKGDTSVPPYHTPGLSDVGDEDWDKGLGEISF